MGISTGNSNQPDLPNSQDDGEIKPEVLPYVPNTPATTKHVPTPGSSWMAGYSYDSTSLRLTIHTKSGAEFQHLMVYPNQFTEMQLHPSAGQYYSMNIKGKHAIVHVKRIAKLDNFPTNHGGSHNAPKDRFQNPTNNRYKKGRYDR